MEEYTLLHRINILAHVIVGTTALLLGIVILLSKKGNKTHGKLGRWFLVFLSVVIVTGLMGYFLFKINQFLLVLTLLSGYNGYSGFRIVKLKSNSLNPFDIIVALVTLGSGIFFLYHIESVGMIWSPVIIYSTIGALFFFIAYDFARYLIPKTVYGKLWLYEHIYKMITAFTALLAAATGTILPKLQPYSQFLPSVFGTFLALGFIIYYYRINLKTTKS